MKAYFLTGATGVVGSAVMARLLAEPQARVLALVRARSAREAAVRLDGTLAALGVSERSSDDSRVRALMGDAEQPEFGLAAADLSALAASCSHIIHCAGAVRMNLPLAAARRAAVDAARNILNLAQGVADAGRLAKVEVVSTVGVGGRDHRLLREEWVGAEHRFHNSYEQAKAEAEQLVRQAIEAGLPVTLHRPSMVVGDSRTGHALHFQIFYFLIEFLSGRRTHGFLPNLGSARLDIVPVDFVAEAIVRSSQTGATAGEILHLCAGAKEALPLRRLQAVVREHLLRQGLPAPKPRYIPPRMFRWAAQALRFIVDAKTGAALATLPVFLDYLNTDQAFENARSMARFKELGIAAPQTEIYLPRVLDYYIAQRAALRADAAS